MLYIALWAIFSVQLVSEWCILKLDFTTSVVIHNYLKNLFGIVQFNVTEEKHKNEISSENYTQISITESINR